MLFCSNGFGEGRWVRNSWAFSVVLAALGLNSWVFSGSDAVNRGSLAPLWRHCGDNSWVVRSFSRLWAVIMVFLPLLVALGRNSWVHRPFWRLWALIRLFFDRFGGSGPWVFVGLLGDSGL